MLIVLHLFGSTLQRTMIISVACLLGGDLGHGHRRFFPNELHNILNFTKIVSKLI